MDQNTPHAALAAEFDVINPATGAVAGTCPAQTSEDLDAAVAAARKAFPAWAATSEADRQAALMRIADAMEAEMPALAQLITEEQGKPLGAYGGKGSMFETGGSIAWTRATAGFELPVKVLSDDDSMRVELHHKPLGVVASITPWNWPLLIAIWHVIPALRTGNTVVVKPSSMTPLATRRFVEIANTVLPAGVLNIVTGEGGLGAAMASHPGVDKIVFTGSTPTGRRIMANAADTLKRLTLELGGNDAGIVLDDADPAAIAAGIFDGAFINNGQTCAALKRLYVPESLHDALCDELVKIAASVKTANGLEDGADFGPLQNKAQYDFVRELADDARAQGATILTGGAAPADQDGYFYPITLVSNIGKGSRLVEEEQFGPILPIIKYADLEEVIAEANDCEVGLGGSVWSSDPDRAAAVAKRLECGTVWVNGHGGLAPHVPFGGVKQSGFGVEFGAEGMSEYTSLQAVHISKR